MTEDPGESTSPAAAIPATAIPATAGWRPMSFGDVDPRFIADPVFEPHWAGRRALAEVAHGAAVIRDVDLGEAPRSAELRAAIAAACGADEAILDGYLVPGTLPPPDAVPTGRTATSAISRGGMVRHMLLGSVVRGRSGPRSRPAAEPPVALPADGPIAFAVVDLLWLDGQSLVDLPLGERKRLLESVLSDADLVRRAPSVRAPAERWHGQWRALGFDEMVVKGANSRYVPGGRSPDWTVAPIPRL